MDPEDIDVEDLIGSSGTDVSSKSLEDIYEKVSIEGVVYLDDKGKMLISCPCYKARKPLVCPVFPVPDPDGDTKLVCSGPKIRYNNSNLVDEVEKVSRKPDSSCPYNPNGLRSSGNDDGGSGWL